MSDEERWEPTREDWMRGPWDDEPDEEDWVDDYTGYRCAIVRNTRVTGTLCGYVGIPPEHPLHGKDWKHRIKLPEGGKSNFIVDTKLGPIDLMMEMFKDEEHPDSLPFSLYTRVHGGINYADADENYPSPNKGLWWFGFDCGHAGDYAPRIDALTARLMGHELGPKYGEKYRDWAYVKAEVTGLAAQLKSLEHLPKADS